MKLSSCLVAFVATSLLVAGCGPPPAVEQKPSYAELVVIYNAEQEALDRLERRRRELIAEYEQQMRPAAADARALADIFNSANEVLGGQPWDGNADPQALLDQAAERADAAQQAGAQLFETLAAQAQPQDQHAEPSPEQVARTEEFQQELGLLDEEIEQQRARVERARQARDAAE